MKKSISIMIIVITIISIISTAFAAGTNPGGFVRQTAGAQASPNEWDIPLAGIDRWDAQSKAWVAVPEADLESTWATIHEMVTRRVTVKKVSGTSANVEAYKAKTHMPEYRLTLAGSAAEAAIVVRLPGNSKGISPLKPSQKTPNRIVGEDPTDWQGVFSADGTLVVYRRQAAGKDVADAVHDGYVHTFCYQGSGSGSKKPSTPTTPTSTPGPGTGFRPAAPDPTQGPGSGTGFRPADGDPTQGSGSGTGFRPATDSPAEDTTTSGGSDWDI